MRHARWLAALLLGFLAMAEVRAQGLYYQTAPWPGGRALGFGRHGRHWGLSAYLASPYDLGCHSVYSYAGLPGGQITIIYTPPQACPAPQVVVMPVTVINNTRQATGDADRLLVIQPRERPLSEEEARQRGILTPPGARAPERLAKPTRPGDEARPPAKAKPKAPPAPQPQERPANELDQQLARARSAFADGEYGLAERRWRQVVAQDPARPLPHFLLAQALLARGRYQEAMEAIHAGLRLKPDWTQERFRLAELYGLHADDFTEQVKHLRDLVALHPRDPVLLFLLAYELWFDGKQDEARQLFQRAANVAPDPTFINRFLQA